MFETLFFVSLFNLFVLRFCVVPCSLQYISHFLLLQMASEDARIKALIKEKGRGLINLQVKVRQEVLQALRINSTVENGLNPKAFRRVKQYRFHDAYSIERQDYLRHVQLENARRHRHASFIQNTIEASKNFAQFHKNNRTITNKLRRAVVNYFSNSENQRKREEEKKEKLRMLKLMQEDEEGYRQLLDEKKDKRLVYLLQQTDEYVKSLTSLVREHQQSAKQKQKLEREAAQRPFESMFRSFHNFL